MRRFAFVLAVAAVTTGACSLGLRESQVRSSGPGGAGGGNGGHGASNPAGGATTNTGGASSSVSTATTGILCGDGSCDAGEDCSSCPGDCGCEQSQGCESGACVDCPSSWSTDLPDTLATRGLVATRGRLFLAPTANSSAALVDVDGCEGTFIIKNVAAPDGNGSVGGPIASSPMSTTFVAGCGFFPGSDPGAALVVGGDPGPTVAWQRQRNGSSGADTVNGGGTAGAIWMVSGARQASPQGWIVYGDLAGQHICSDTTALAGAIGDAITSDGAKLYAAAHDGGGIHIAVFDASACNPAGCDCSPTAMLPAFSIGNEATTVATILFAAGSLYLAGFGSDDGTSFFGFVAKVSPTTGAVDTAATYRHSTSNKLDQFVSLGFDSNFIYAGGYQGGSSSTDVSDAQGLLVGLSTSLGATAQFTSLPTGAHSVVGIATDENQPGKVFVQFDRAPGSSVARCASADGGCP